MKTKLFILLILVLFFWSCKEEKRIEIVPNLELEYLSSSEVSKPAKLILRNQDSAKSKAKKYTEAINDRNEKFVEAIKSIHDSQTKDTVRYIIMLRLYINENGRVDKIKDGLNYLDKSEFSNDGIRNYMMRDKMNEALAKKIAELYYEPAVNDGKKVKFWTDLRGVNVLAIPDGSFQIEKSDFLSYLRNQINKLEELRNKKPDYLSKAKDLKELNEKIFFLQQRLEDSYNRYRYTEEKNDYLLATENMPSPIGGLGSIQKNIKYPQLAKLAGIEGRVMVLAFIDESGNVVDAQIIKGIGAGCDEAALDAVKGAKFTPGKQQGKPVKVQVTIPIVFKLQ